MKQKTFSMAAQLKKGKAAEKKFLQEHGQGCIERTDGRKGDFRIKWSQIKVELKSDFYAASNNLFIERWSVVNDAGQKNGGPWQSSDNDNKYFIYWFVESNELFLFDLDFFVPWLETVLPSLKKILVKNKGYHTEGYLLPKALVKKADKKSGYMGSDLSQILLFRWEGEGKT